ncbi:MAG: hypothetical protein ACRDA5_09640 [Clostridium sp.]
MNIDYKIRKTTLETAINVLLINKVKSTPRTARNIIDIGCSLSRRNITTEIEIEIYNKLIELIPSNNIKEIKSFVINSFL